MTTITIDRATVEQALEALEYENSWHEIFKIRPYASTVDAITTLRSALAQQTEPAQAISECIAVLRPMVKGKFPHEQALDELVGYTAPPRRTMVPLTEEEIFKIENDIPDDVISDRAWTICLTRAVEKAVWEKNHGQA